MRVPPAKAGEIHLLKADWIDTPLGEEEYYRCGVKFVNLAPENMERLRNILKKLSALRNPPVNEEKFSSLKSIISNSGKTY